MISTVQDFIQVINEKPEYFTLVSSTDNSVTFKLTDKMAYSMSVGAVNPTNMKRAVQFMVNDCGLIWYDLNVEPEPIGSLNVDTEEFSLTFPEPEVVTE